MRRRRDRAIWRRSAAADERGARAARPVRRLAATALDAIVSAAREAGALGAKLTGRRWRRRGDRAGAGSGAGPARHPGAGLRSPRCAHVG